jgi:hypothetical protein
MDQGVIRSVIDNCVIVVPLKDEVKFFDTLQGSGKHLSHAL